MKSIFSKVMWVGRATVFTVGLAVVLAVMLGVATTALAAAPGAPFKLGKVNVINKVTKLVGKAKSPRLVIDNNGSGVALSLQVEPGSPPMQVNSTEKVANLNADSLDGLDQGAFLRKTGKATDADKVDGKDSTEFLGTNQKAADSNRLDGKDSTVFLSSDNYYRKSESRSGDLNGFNEGTLSCNSGDALLSGGFLGSNKNGGHVYDSSPSPSDKNGWRVVWTGQTNIGLSVLCVDLTPLGITQ